MPSGILYRAAAVLLGGSLLACEPVADRLPEVFERVECFEDTTAERKLPAVRESRGWRSCPGSELGRGFSQSAYWLRLSGARVGAQENRIISFQWKTLGRVEFWQASGERSQSERGPPVGRAGIEFPRSTWALDAGDYPAFALRLHPDSEYYFRVSSASFIRVPVMLHAPPDFIEQFRRETLAINLLSGVALTVILVSFLFSLLLRDPIYASYALGSFFFGLALNALYGNAFRTYWPESPYLAARGIVISYSFLMIFWIAFFLKLTRMRDQNLLLFRFLRANQWIAVLLVPFVFFDLPRVFFVRVYLFCIASTLTLMIAYMVRRVIGYRETGYIVFVIAWGIYLKAAALAGAYWFGAIDYSYYAVYAQVLALPLEIILFGAGLVLRYQDLLSEKAELIRDKQAVLKRMEELHNPGRYETSRLGNLDVDGLLLRLNDLLETEHIYREPELTLEDLAGRLDLNRHQFSELLNARLNVNFRQLLLNHRLRAAEQQMLSEPEKSVLRVALEVGFNSKTAFNVAFKKKNGLSPTEFRARGGIGPEKIP